MDGVDGVLLDLATPRPTLLAYAHTAFEQPLRQTLFALNRSGADELHQAALAANALARCYAHIVLRLLQQAQIPAAQVRAIGAHGQTVRHRPQAFDGWGYTLQINQPALLAELTGITVIADFRSRDVAAGGQGAPLVPRFHQAVFAQANSTVAVLNLGGISNLTVIPALTAARADAVVGFDCGPGNSLLDSWCLAHTGQGYDLSGAWAASGKVVPELLERLQSEPYFDLPPPKSTGRDLFNMAWLERHLSRDEAPADVQATLLELTSESIAAAVQRFCSGTKELYLCGGGAHNEALVAHLRHSLPQCRIQKTEVLGIAADWMEAIAFAWLAQQALHLRPANLPAVTGARHPCVLGAIYPA